jgi:hypothetical protein
MTAKRVRLATVSGAVIPIPDKIKVFFIRDWNNSDSK